MFLIAVSTSLLPFSCSRMDSVNRALAFFTCSARLKIVLNFSSAVLDEVESVSISLLSVFNVAVIVFPCIAESSDNLRISSATTAKPFPASPACAASIAAFIASKFVCDAICWITLDASISDPDSSAIFCVTVLEVTSVALPSPVAEVRLRIALSFFSSVCVIEAILATICSTEEDDWATLAACVSIPLLSCLIVLTISSIVEAVSVTLAAWVSACCLTPSMFALISLTALAVSIMLDASSSPISSILRLFIPTCWIDTPIFAIVSLKYSAISVISSLPVTGSRTVKSPSPWAISRNIATAVRIGLTILWATKYTTIRPINSTLKPTIYNVRRSALIAPINSLYGALIIMVHGAFLSFAWEAIL